jgi:hypothetical protein
MNRQDYKPNEIENDPYSGTFLSLLHEGNVIFDAYQMESSFVNTYNRISDSDKENIQSYSDSVKLFFMNNMDHDHLSFMHNDASAMDR